MYNVPNGESISISHSQFSQNKELWNWPNHEGVMVYKNIGSSSIKIQETGREIILTDYFVLDRINQTFVIIPS